MLRQRAIGSQHLFGYTMLARKFSTVVLLGAGTLLLTNCSDDTTLPGPSTGGSGNVGGGGATSGAGGSAAGASSGGGGASAGGSSAGTGGSGTAGSGGAGGSAAGAAGSSGGGAGGAGGSGGATGGGGSGGAGAFTLSSPDLMNGANFLDKNTCNGKPFGQDESPALMWTDPPAGTKSFALTFLDVTLLAPDPTSRFGHHWMAYNIPAATRALPANLPDGTTLTTPVALKQVPQGYLGPCPGGMTDTYEFTLYALSVDTLDPGAGTALTKDMVDKVKAVSLGSAVLSGKSNAQSQ